MMGRKSQNSNKIRENDDEWNEESRSLFRRQ